MKRSKPKAAKVKQRKPARGRKIIVRGGRGGLDYVEADASGVMAQIGLSGFATPMKVKPGEDVRAAARRVLGVVTPKGKHKRLPPRPVDTRWPSEIKVGHRHRKDMGDLNELAREIDEVGALLHRIPITAENRLIAGERRLRAWPLTRFGREPIPVTVVPVKDILRGEWSENYGRKDFTPSEAVAIVEELEPRERKRQLALMAERPSESRAAPGRKAAPGQAEGRVADRAAKFVGMHRTTIDKAREVVKAADAEPEKFGKLKADMDRTGNVSGPHKRLKNIQQGEALRKAPPGVPMRGPYQAIVIDPPWPQEPEATQEEIDAAGRSLRPYAAMSLQEICRFMADKVKAILADDCSVALWTTNFHMRHAFQVLHALGIDQHSTIETWRKDMIGRGQVRRDQTEHVIIGLKGKPTITLTNQSTIFDGPRRENSRKPDEFYARFEAVHPAPRYAEIFSRGGRGPNWDCHGDQVGTFAAGDPADAEALKEPGNNAAIAERYANDELAVLEAIARGETFGADALIEQLVKARYVAGNRKKRTLTAAGDKRMQALQAEPRKAPPAQHPAADRVGATAARAAGGEGTASSASPAEADDQLDIPGFLRRPLDGTVEGKVRP